jgi:hypothetical protein
VLAASLAQAGFTGPRTVIEGEFGFLRVFCTEFDEAELTRNLGHEYVTLSTVLKRYPVHATAHAAVRAVHDLQGEHRFAGGDVEAITVTGNRRMIERHNIAEPADLMLAQYSIPFCVALSLHREARDPESYDESALADPQIRALTRRVRLIPEGGGSHGAMGSTVTVTLADGRHFERHVDSGLLEAGELADKFTRLTRGVLGVAGANYSTLLERSADWTTYRAILASGYPDPLDVAMAVSLFQMRWDKVEGAGVANSVLAGTPTGVPAKQILIQIALGDEQVPNLGSYWLARTMGIPILGPTPTTPWGLAVQPSPLPGGSAMVIMDGGAPPPPATNLPATSYGMHTLTRKQPATRRQIKAFFETGQIINECDGACVCQAAACD